jgi:hypothetical protein
MKRDPPVDPFEFHPPDMAWCRLFDIVKKKLDLLVCREPRLLRLTAQQQADLHKYLVFLQGSCACAGRRVAGSSVSISAGESALAFSDMGLDNEIDQAT